jgi:hypothetical protein
MDNMTFKELLDQMRARLSPYNETSEHKIVKMGIHSNYGYMECKTVQEAIDFFEKRSLTAYALGEQLNPLEALGAILLLESAYLRDAAK